MKRLVSKHFYALECLLFLTLSCQKEKRILPNNNSKFEIPNPPALSPEVTRLKKKYEAQTRSYTDAFIPELDWHKIQKLKGRLIYRIPIAVENEQRNVSYLLLNQEEEKLFYSTRVGTENDNMVFIHSLDGDLDHFIFQKDGERKAFKFKSKVNNPYHIRFTPNMLRYSIDSVDIYPSYPDFPGPIDLGSLGDGGGDWSNFGGGGDGGDPPPPPPKPDDPKPDKPCPGNPVKNPSIAPSGGWNTKGGRYGEGVRTDRNTGLRRDHNGIDIQSPLNSPLYAMHGGTVVHAGYGKDFGNFVIISSTINGSTVQTTYAHLNQINVHKDQYIEQGAVFGLSGNTGNAKGTIPHVHIEAKEFSGAGDKIGKRVDPEKYIETKFDDKGKPDPNTGQCK